MGSSGIQAAAMYTPDPALKGFLDPNDPVALSFWIISIAMVPATVFFLMESMAVGSHWKTSLNVGALVTLVAAVHYFYMGEYWVQLGSSPIVYLILSAVQPNIDGGMFWRLLLGTVAMLVAGYCGEAGFVNAWAGFMVGMAGWAFILYEIFAGEANKVAQDADKISENVRTSFNTMRIIVSAGWCIYPLGYFFGYLMGSVDASTLNLIYNIADVINKIAFCLAIWHSAKKDTMEKGESLLA